MHNHSTILYEQTTQSQPVKRSTILRLLCLNTPVVISILSWPLALMTLALKKVEPLTLVWPLGELIGSMRPGIGILA